MSSCFEPRGGGSVRGPPPPPTVYGARSTVLDIEDRLGERIQADSGEEGGHDPAVVRVGDVFQGAVPDLWERL